MKNEIPKQLPKTPEYRRSIWIACLAMCLVFSGLGLAVSWFATEHKVALLIILAGLIVLEVRALVSDRARMKSQRLSVMGISTDAQDGFYGEVERICRECATNVAAQQPSPSSIEWASIPPRFINCNPRAQEDFSFAFNSDIADENWPVSHVALLAVSLRDKETDNTRKAYLVATMSLRERWIGPPRGEWRGTSLILDEQFKMSRDELVQWIKSSRENDGVAAGEAGAETGERPDG